MALKVGSVRAPRNDAVSGLGARTDRGLASRQVFTAPERGMYCMCSDGFDLPVGSWAGWPSRVAEALSNGVMLTES